MTKRFIVTDPCYIMDSEQYDRICDEDDCDFEGQSFPLKSVHRNGKKEIVFHGIKATLDGDGSFILHGRTIGVDSGMLCVAECEKGWRGERLGYPCETFREALALMKLAIRKI